MALKFFEIDGKGFAPKASIRQYGQIGLNQGAINRYGIVDGRYVLLGYDKEKQMIAIKLLDKHEKGAKKVLVRTTAGTSTSGSISAKSFLDYFEIPYKKSDSFNLDRDENTGYLVFYLKQLEKNTSDSG